MACQPCTSSPINGSIPSFSASYNDCGCTDCNCEGGTMDSKCVFYTGPNLPCASINTNESFEDILIKIDQKLCASLGNYSLYDTYCLNDNTVIATEQQFVETISSFVCSLRTDFDTFVDDTFAGNNSTLNDRFTLIEQPGINCATAGVNSADSLGVVLGKYCTKFSDLDNKLDLSGVAWNSCYTVNPAPTTLTEAFNALIGQICDVKNSGINGILPTFNNVGSCLGGTLTASDSLEDTVNKLKDRVCLAPTFDINALTWGCLTKPSSETTDLQAALDAILAKVSVLAQNTPTFSSDFVVSLTGGDACQGKTVGLAATSILDKYVAVDGSDASPGTLANKLVAGSGVSFDYGTTPGKLIINSLGGTGSGNGTVKSRVADPTAGYLEEKIQGSTSTSGITTTVSTDTTANKVTTGVSVNFATLWTKLLETLTANPTLKGQFCDMVTSCLPDCVVPPNVTVIYNNTNSTTTTTTTTA
jgi:hypothetical protein